MKRNLISTARQVAFDVLLRVATESAFASDLLFARLSKQKLRGEDAALATELTLGVLRWQRRLDWQIDRHIQGKKLDAAVRIALRLGTYQILSLDRIPAHAAVNESVELVKHAGLSSAAGLVNAVLRKIAADHASNRDLPFYPKSASETERLAIRASHPTWLAERWLARFGDERSAALFAANNRPAPVSLNFAGATLESLGVNLPADARLEPGSWLSSAFLLQSGRAGLLSLFEPLLAARRISFQDEASQMVAHLLGVQPGDCVLDVCSAPGGKSAMLARAAGSTGRLVAADLHLHRLRAMKKRHHGSAASSEALIALDAAQPLPFSNTFDRILVDVPCSGTGTLARNPEIRWRLTPEDLLDLQSRQRAILANAIDALAPGGRLVYSTCSLEPEENEQVVDAVLAQKSNARVCLTAHETLRPHLHPAADVNVLFDASGYFRTFPPEHHTDGFFAAVIEHSQ